MESYFLFAAGVILGGLASWYITHRYYRKSSADQRTELERLAEQLRHRNTLADFEPLLSSSKWEKEEIEDSEVWICQADNTFQIALGKSKPGFSEPWTMRFPNPSAAACPVRLKIGSSVVKELLFVHMDGYRIFVPIADVRTVQCGERKFEYFWSMGSLDMKVCRIIGSYHVHKTIENVAAMAGVEIVD